MSSTTRQSNFGDIMVNNEILEGLKQSIARGESLAIAALTFKNAGYIETEVDEAVNALSDKPVYQEQQPVQVDTQKIPISKPAPTTSPQLISSYEQKPRKKFFESGWFIAVLVVLLFILFGCLLTLFFFKDQITSFLNDLLV